MPTVHFACLLALLLCVSATARAQIAQGDRFEGAQPSPSGEALDPSALDSLDDTTGAIEPERSAMARALFTRGVEHAREARYAEAADLFRRAHALRPAPGIAYNLASALAQLGELVEASELLHWVLRHEDTSPAMARAAQQTIDLIAPRLAHVRVILAGPREQIAITLDELPLLRAATGVFVPVDPGAHVLAAHRGEDRVASAALDLSEGERREVTLIIPPLPPVEDAAAAPLRPERTTEPAPPGEDWSWLAWAGGAAALVAAVVITTVLVVDAQAGPQPIEGTTMPPIVEWD